ncbi:citrate lyase subunit beta-like protein [Kocuria dechangensis]|uniref:Citrate lyase subunit beta-like protein n=1 Tax=Kocuria dechangensis TaxID=1176249 RepID=A0A917GWD0_9MICC|nr:CoA ester lyase [Kocuria dechangensis]GGG58779.1 citrate lyase subunit beta-like protein [Kocuria dechangensis]
MTGTFPPGPALLFCPADRPERYAKAAERADAVILDLEDAVAPSAKLAARDALVATPLDPARTIVRLNAEDTEDFAHDLVALRHTAYTTVMLPKAVSAERLAVAAELGLHRVVALCETPEGVVNAAEIARAENVVALMWGAEDLVASLGGTSSRRPDGGYRDVARHARSAVLLAAAAAGKPAIDAVHVDIADLDGLRAEALDAAAVGFAATACIHPGQVGTVRTAYRPAAEEVAAARELLEAARGAAGVFTFRGRMVDEPLLRHAERLVRRAEA